MLIHHLTPDECRAVLRRTRLARLACEHQGQPYVVPVHVYYDSEYHCLYGFSTVGQKVEWMRENPKVCVGIDEISDRNHWLTVVTFGVYEEIPDDDAGRPSWERAQRLVEDRREWWFPAVAKTESQERHAVVLYRIRIGQMTGRRAARDQAGG